MRVAILIISILFTSNVFAQRIQTLKKAHNFYKDKEYESALVEYEKLWNSGSGAKILGVDGKMNLADCYRMTDQPFKAKDLYIEVLPYFEDNLDNYLHYGQVLMQMGQYNDAVGQFERHSELMPEDGRAAEYVKRIDAIREIQPLYEIVTFVPQDNVNDSLTRQTGVTYYGDAVVYSSDELANSDMVTGPQGYFNMRIAGVNSEGNLKESEKFSVSLNGKERHDGPATFSRDGRMIYYSQSVKDPEGNSVLQIWISSFKDDVWTEAQPLPIMFQGKNFTHPSLSGDNKQLYFASDMKGTFGGLDIWVSNFEDGRWTYPKNLGKDINTAQDDGWPYIHPDGDLYFSSKGHAGYGGYDIYRTRPLGNGVDWLDIENMGKPFNSSFNDVSFILADDQTQGFLSSNQSRSYDIFKFEIEGVEPMPIPDDLTPRISIGISERDVHGDLTPPPSNEVIVDPPQAEGESDVDYIERVNQFRKNVTPPSIDEGKPKANPTNPGTNPTTNPGTNEGGVTTPTEEIVPDKIELIVKLQLVDGFGNPIPAAKVSVKNKFTGKNVVYNADAEGLAEIRLDPDQKYTLTGKKEGYTEGSIPVSTMGATKTQRVGANLQLRKE